MRYKLEEVMSGTKRTIRDGFLGMIGLCSGKTTGEDSKHTSGLLLKSETHTQAAQQM